METYDKLVKVFGDKALSRAQVFRWHKIFKNGRESVGDEPRSRRPVEVRTDNNVQRVRTLVHQDRRLTVRMLADELNLKRETVRKILTDDLSMKKLCAKMVPKNLSACLQEDTWFYSIVLKSDQGIKENEGHIRFEEDLIKESAISLP
ncbi:Winged helix-turn-helix DNA-binding domain [Cinara cedri]|uniref:Winged helix-turn-helix DNA-binding domain n=1 Tax=Cinara cedri TaxID=506608 RepID=A0A5E4MZR9_9HEMI|nr:Winged helix-turn-helix DNA-binding domain [Cinara cedri]